MKQGIHVTRISRSVYMMREILYYWENTYTMRTRQEMCHAKERTTCEEAEDEQFWKTEVDG
jgi:hypothetical protein